MNGKVSLLAIIKQSFIQHPYVSVPFLRKMLEQDKIKIKPATINRYLVKFKQDGVIYGTGRSCGITQQFRISMALFLDYAQERKSDAIIQLIESIKAEFSINSPLIDFKKSKLSTNPVTKETPDRKLSSVGPPILSMEMLRLI